VTIDLETGTPLQLETGVNFTLELPWQEALENPIEDIYVKSEGGNWISIYASLIQDNMTVDNKTWSSEKITAQDGLRTRWMGEWQSGVTYEANDQVEDDFWLMIANKQTTDRAAPVAVGSPAFVYTGASPDAAVTVKQMIFGNRYTAPATDVSYQTSKFRVYTVIGNSYRVFSVVDPLGAPVVNELALFTAATDGWSEFNADLVLIPSGQTFDIVATVAEPDPTPTTFTGNWLYQTPQNNAAPASGQIIHSRGQPDIFNIHKTDNDAVDRTADLSGLTVGDIIDYGNGGTRWAIQSITDNTTYYTYAVSPLITEAAGVNLFTFETVTATPITRMEDVDWWTNNPGQNGGTVQGLYIEDDSYENIVPNGSAYGTDIELQLVEASTDWDFQAVSGSGNASSETLSTLEMDWVRVSAEPYDIFNVQTTDNSWTTAFVIDAIPVGEAVTGIGLVKAVRTDADDYYLTEFRVIAANTGGGIAVNETQLYELGPIQLAIRVQQVGLNAEVQVRGIINQDWSWTGLVYFSPM
jgi:hypothetical protein